MSDLALMALTIYSMGAGATLGVGLSFFYAAWDSRRTSWMSNEYADELRGFAIRASLLFAVWPIVAAIEIKRARES